LRGWPAAVVLETNGGAGRLFEECYRPADVTAGAVFEKEPAKAEMLARQRPTWAVYEADCIAALAAGAAGHLVFNFIDVDPYGAAFPVIEAALSHPKRLADRIRLVVNDGLRQKVQLGGAWSVDCLADIVAEFGNNLYPVYLDVAKEKTRRLARAAGFELVEWSGYYCGHAGGMTHYSAELLRSGATSTGSGRRRAG